MPHRLKFKFKLVGPKITDLQFEFYKKAYPQVKEYSEKLRKTYVSTLQQAVISNEYSPKHSWFKVGKRKLKNFPYYKIVARKVNKRFRRSPTSIYTQTSIFPLRFRFMVGYDLNICPYADFIENGTKLRRIFVKLGLAGRGPRSMMAFVPWWDTKIAMFKFSVKHKSKGKFLIKKVHKIIEALLRLGHL